LLTAELNETDAGAESEADQNRARPHRWTQQEAREAARLSRESRGKRGEREPPSDAEIERGLRERAVNSARDAEVLLRWRQTVRADDSTPGVDLESLSERELERLYAGLLRLASLDETVLAALLEQVLAEEEPASSFLASRSHWEAPRKGFPRAALPRWASRSGSTAQELPLRVWASVRECHPASALCPYELVRMLAARSSEQSRVILRPSRAGVVGASQRLRGPGSKADLRTV
jgi:hypothetical protein